MILLCYSNVFKHYAMGQIFNRQSFQGTNFVIFQDYRVHIKHDSGRFEYIPYFSLPANDLNDVIAKSCYSCFDYVNYLADIVVGYMGVPYQNVDMTSHG